MVWCVLMKGLSQGWKGSWGDVLSIPEGQGCKPSPAFGHLVIIAAGTVNTLWASLVAQTESAHNVETWVRSLGWEDPLEEGMAVHASILAWRIPMDRGACWATVQRVAKSRT